MASKWAKAPEHHDPAGVATNAREFLDAGLTPVRCHGCASEVLVRKSSPMQTSVQWHSDPATTCPEFAARVADGEVRARIDTCARLRESIEKAVADGRVAVPDA
jgi:hypothetical protein